MGCDIHLYVEKQINGKWTSIDEWHPDDWDPERQIVPFDLRYYNGRNYDLFGILANVRNGIGFGGIDTGDGFIPITQPRGLPDNCSSEVATESAEWGSDGHSHSYLTLAELIAYNWEQTTKRRGWVNATQYTDRDECGRPKSWCGGVSGASVKHVTEKTMQQLIAVGKATDKHYCQIEWEVEYYYAVGTFVTETIPRLKELSEGDYNSIRIVFWFDN